jgi:hypothetical protein
MNGQAQPVITGEPNHPTQERLEDQICWYDRKSQTAQRRYKILKLAQVIIAGLIPWFQYSKSHSRNSNG